MLKQQDLLLLEELLVQRLEHVGRAVVLKVQLEFHYCLLVPIPYIPYLFNDFALRAQEAFLQSSVALLIYFDEPREAIMGIVLFLH